MRQTIAAALALAAALVLAACASATAQPLPAQAPAAAPSVAAGDLTISDVWMRPAGPVAAAPTAMSSDSSAHAGGHTMNMGVTVTTGAYMTIANRGAEADALVGVSAQPGLAEAIELHTVIDEGGVMRMRPVEQIEVPANGEVALQPGGYHVMFIGVQRELREGDTVALTLEFARAGAIEVQAVVRSTP